MLAALGVSAALGACNEDVEGGAACPILCPEQNVSVFDTVFDAVDMDTSLNGYPPFGSEPSLVLGARGDTLDTRAVLRFDSLFAFFTTDFGDSAVEAIDSAYLVLHIDKANSLLSAPVTIDVFNVDTIEPDTLTSLELPLFRPDRLITSVTFDTSQIGDSITIRLDSAFVMGGVVDRNRVRLGLRASSPDPLMLQIVSSEGGTPPTIKYDGSADTAVGVVTNTPVSLAPGNKTIALDYADYLLVVKAPPPPAGPYLPIGGIPGRRAYLSFVIPKHIQDSSTVLRATLELTQYPNRDFPDNPLITLYPQLVTAGTDVIDLQKSALLLAPATVLFDTVQVAPADSGAVNLEVVNALRTWALPIAVQSQRAVVLRTPGEGLAPRFVVFYSTAAPPGLRPRLRVSYSPQVIFGVP